MVVKSDVRSRVLRHIFLVTHAALPLLKRAAPGSSIMSLSSIEGYRGYPLGAVAGGSGRSKSRVATQFPTILCHLINCHTKLPPIMVVLL